MKLALDFDKDFKFLKFCIDIDGTSTEKEASSSNVVNTFDKMMGASQAVNKLHKRKEKAINKFTADHSTLRLVKADRPYFSLKKAATMVACSPRVRWLRSPTLTVRESRAFDRLLTKYDYCCGSVITPEGDALEGVVNVCLQIDCNTHVEFPYYASTLAQPDICAFCAAVGATKDQDAIKTHRIVLPVCRDCVIIGKLPPKRNPIK
ncbi:unnamed protein product [Mytilus coruscus]|uniref:Uncharacterized protein n=1 Tax=Mytilus coruscus TaxID=42192 RepID=A0A6J8BKF7_MYTCO|nr:unnamed protein product [Mytilus coruscus]